MWGREGSKFSKVVMKKMNEKEPSYERVNDLEKTRIVGDAAALLFQGNFSCYLIFAYIVSKVR